MNVIIKRHRIGPIVLIFILTILIGLGCTSDALDEKLYSDVSVDNFYKSEGEVNLALNGVYARMTDEGFYRALMWVALTDIPGGILRGGAESNGSGDKSNQSTPWNNFTWTSDAHETDVIWEVNYDGINRANMILHKLPDSNLSSGQKEWYEGQTKFLRAFYYFNLVRIFGDVPLIVTPTLDLTDIEKPRTSSDEVYAQIEQDLEDAETLLSPYSEADHSSGRVTSAAAKALLSKVHLQQRDWPNAANKAKEVMDMGVFDLYDDFRDVLRPANGTGKEMIFSCQMGGEANENGSVYFTKGVYLWGPPQTNLPDGTSVKFNDIKFPVTFQVEPNFYESTPETYRKKNTMTDRMSYYYLGDELIQSSVDLYAPFLTKFRYMNFDTGSLHEGVPFPIIRYSDVLLTYAEAINEANSGPTSEAYKAINKVRQRARAVGTPDEQQESIYPNLSGLSQTEFRDAIIDERGREFIGEGLMRDVLLRHDRYISNANELGANAEEHHKIFPLPGSALSTNENLEQNPGY